MNTRPAETAGLAYSRGLGRPSITAGFHVHVAASDPTFVGVMDADLPVE